PGRRHRRRVRRRRGGTRHAHPEPQLQHGRCRRVCGAVHSRPHGACAEHDPGFDSAAGAVLGRFAEGRFGRRFDERWPMSKSMKAMLYAAALCAAPAARSEDTVVKVGFCARTITSAAAPFAVAMKKGWYATAGMKVQLVPVPGSTDCVKLVATGDLPYSLPSIEPMPAARQQGIKGKIFYTAYQGNIYGIAVAKDAPIQSIKDLKGKKIGVASMGSAGVHVARGLLAMNGLDPDTDAQLVVVGEAAQAAAMLRGGQVSALSLYDTQYALIDSAGQPVRLLDSGPVARFPSNGFFALEETLQKRRAEAVALTKGYAMGTVFSMANPEAAVRILYEVYPQTKPTGK